MICLSIIGSDIAGTHYYAVDLPQQQNVQAPANGSCSLSIVSTLNQYANCGSDCNLCLASGENTFQREVPSSDKMSICGSG